MNTMYKCKAFFKSAKGKYYSYGDVIPYSEFNTLYYNERNNFTPLMDKETQSYYGLKAV